MGTEILNVKKDNKQVIVEYDELFDSCRSWDNLTTMIFFHNRYRLGDENHGLNSSDYSSWDEVKKAIYSKEGGKRNIAIIKPVYMYDHSGITIKTSPFDCSWDSGQIGWVYITKDKLRENFGIKRITKKYIKKGDNLLESEIKTYDTELSGEIYHVSYKENDELIDSIGGLYGMPDVEMYIKEIVTDESIANKALAEL